MGMNHKGTKITFDGYHSIKFQKFSRGLLIEWASNRRRDINRKNTVCYGIFEGWI